jgi:hypothetical protein
MRGNTEFWRFIHSNPWESQVGLGQSDPLSNKITIEWPGILAHKNNPISAVGPPAQCSGDVGCYGMWYDGSPVEAKQINIGPFSPPLAPEGAPIQPVDQGSPMSASMPPVTPQGNPTPVNQGQLTTGCSICSGTPWKPLGASK